MKRDHLAGTLLLVLGLGAATEAYAHKLGTLRQMGPGLMPFALALALAALGIAIAALANHAVPEPPLPGEHAEFAGAEWRGWSCIVGAVLAFLILGTHGGMVPATFACVFIAAIGDRQSTLREALTLATTVTIAGVLLFSYLLKIQLPLWQWGTH